MRCCRWISHAAALHRQTNSACKVKPWPTTERLWRRVAARTRLPPPCPPPQRGAELADGGHGGTGREVETRAGSQFGRKIIVAGRRGRPLQFLDLRLELALELLLLRWGGRFVDLIPDVLEDFLSFLHAFQNAIYLALELFGARHFASAPPLLAKSAPHPLRPAGSLPCENRSTHNFSKSTLNFNFQKPNFPIFNFLKKSKANDFSL